MLNPDITYRELSFNKQLVFRKGFDLLEGRKPSFVLAPLAFPRKQIQLFAHCKFQGPSPHGRLGMPALQRKAGTGRSIER